MTRQKRQALFSVRPSTLEERQEIVRLAAERGISVNALFLDSVLNRLKMRGDVRLDPKAVVRLQAQVASVQDSLQALRADLRAVPEGITRCERELIDIRNLLMHSIGRAP
jgi:propanediol dehydratase small subunit